MLALLFSKPKGWQLRPRPLRKLLSREGEAEVGWTRLRRMFSEATAAGYMARSWKQQHEQNGTWGKYEYFVGMPDDVLRAVQKENVELAPQSCGARQDQPRAENDFTNHKERTSKKTELINESPSSPRIQTLRRDQREPSIEAGERSVQRRPERPEVVQQRVAVRLGSGDAETGWLLFGALSPSHRDQLTAMERQGRLGDAEVVDARSAAILAQTSGRGGRL